MVLLAVTRRICYFGRDKGGNGAHWLEDTAWRCESPASDHEDCHRLANGPAHGEQNSRHEASSRGWDNYAPDSLPARGA